MVIDQNEGQIEEKKNVRHGAESVALRKQRRVFDNLLNHQLPSYPRTQIVGGQKEANIKLALKPNNRRTSKKLGRLRPGDTFSQQMVAADQTRTQPPA